MERLIDSVRAEERERLRVLIDRAQNGSFTVPRRFAVMR